MRNITNSYHKQSGFTLIELLFATAILGFMLTITLSTFIGVFRFYTWARTTRTTQQSSRDVLDTMTRLIRVRHISSVSGTNNEIICLDQTSPGSPDKTIQISLNSNHQIESQEYSEEGCASTKKVGTATVISNPSLGVSVLKFQKIDGAVGNSFFSDITKKKLVFSSAIINMTVVNGTPDSSGNCIGGDNFCDVASYTTAVTERRNQ